MCARKWNPPLIAVNFDWAVLKHGSQPIVNPPRWGHDLSYGVVKSILAKRNLLQRKKKEALSRDQQHPAPLLHVLFCFAVINKEITNQSVLTEMSSSTYFSHELENKKCSTFWSVWLKENESWLLTHLYGFKLQLKLTQFNAFFTPLWLKCKEEKQNDYIHNGTWETCKK